MPFIFLASVLSVNIKFSKTCLLLTNLWYVSHCLVNRYTVNIVCFYQNIEAINSHDIGHSFL